MERFGLSYLSPFEKTLSRCFPVAKVMPYKVNGTMPPKLAFMYYVYWPFDFYRFFIKLFAFAVNRNSYNSDQ